ncbi:hypothetical protein [Radicibacter daui]|uniref:hypothetical protein n=1 Tax=Radicibacter daui TaxID=3064829 RepID=UPI004046D9FA
MTGSVSAVSATSARWVAIWGVAAISLSNMPILEFTLPGAAIRLGMIAAGLLLLALNSNRILRGFGAIEAAVLLTFLVISLVAALMPLFLGRNPDIGATMKLMFLILLAYALPKAMTTPQEIERYLRLFYLVVLIAAAQAILSFGAFLIGLRHIGEINIAMGNSDGRYILGWYGLLGASQGTTPRTNFYYSEPSHFGHILIIGLAYALATRRHFGALIIGVGLLTTIGLTAISASVLLVGLFVVRYGRLVRGLLILAPLGIGVAMASGFILHSNLLYSILFRQHSAADKISSIFFILEHLETHPLGIGLTTADATLYPGINLTNGILQYTIFYGVMAIPIVAAIYSFIAWRGLIRPTSELSGIMTMAMLPLLVATVFHGPHLKYWMVFLLSALVSYTRMHPWAQGPAQTSRNRAGVGPAFTLAPTHTTSRPAGPVGLH